jgi:hypothetical protein
MLKASPRLKDSSDTASAEPTSIFVSYSRWDVLHVSRLVARLRTAGISTWVSGPECHCPDWQEWVFPNIFDCAVFLVVMTPRSEVAGGVRQEIDYAESLGKPVMPIALDGWSFLRVTTAESTLVNHRHNSLDGAGRNLKEFRGSYVWNL